MLLLIWGLTMSVFMPLKMPQRQAIPYPGFNVMEASDTRGNLETALKYHSMKLEGLGLLTKLSRTFWQGNKYSQGS